MPVQAVLGDVYKRQVRDRMNDAEAKLIITADGGYRRGNVVPLKINVDGALKGCLLYTSDAADE